MACLNPSWRAIAEPQLYRRLLLEQIPQLNFASDVTPGVGSLVPPIAGETWRSLFSKLVQARRNVMWRPVATVLESSAPSTSDGATVSEVDEEIVTSGPAMNQFMHMPLPDNYDVQDKQAALPKGFEWVALDPHVPDHLARITAFLDANALQDSEEQFKLGWSAAHFQRQLAHPSPLVSAAEAKSGVSHPPPIWAAVQTDGTSGPKNLVAFIAALPVHVRVWSKVQFFYLVRQLCVHRKMRGHRVARVVVKELSRRVHQRVDAENLKLQAAHLPTIDYPPAVFTLGVPMPFRLMTSFGAYHRTFQYKRFIQAGLKPTIDPKDATVAPYTKLENLVPLEADDLPVIFPFVSEFYERFKIAFSYTGAEFAHRFLNRPGYTFSYVLWSNDPSPAIRRPIGFFSFSELHYDILSLNATVKQLKIAYTDVIFPVANIDLVKSMLVIAHDLGFDELEIGGNMEHSEIVTHPDLHFKVGTGRALNFFHNWMSDDVEAKDWAISENN
jgi:glycylpeptide N-tetradecanoyltransferase